MISGGNRWRLYSFDNLFIQRVLRIDDVTSRVCIEEMMVQTEKMLSVGGLVAGMAHEIYSPLVQGCQNMRRHISADLEKNKAFAQKLGIELACNIDTQHVNSHVHLPSQIKAPNLNAKLQESKFLAM